MPSNSILRRHQAQRKAANQRLNSQAWLSLFSAWLVALIATLSALFIGEVMGREICNLCWFQRIFMFSLPIILGIACIREDFGIWRYGLPIALSGLLASIIHIIIYWNILPIMMMPCGEHTACSGKSMAIGRIPIPLLSMLSFSMIIGLLLLAKNRKKQ